MEKEEERRSIRPSMVLVGVLLFAAGLLIGSGCFQNLRTQWMKQNGTFFILEGYSTPWTYVTPDYFPNQVELSDYDMQVKDHIIYLKAKDKRKDSYLLKVEDLTCDPVYEKDGKIEGYEWYARIKDPECTQIQAEDGRNWIIGQTL